MTDHTIYTYEIFGAGTRTRRQLEFLCPMTKDGLIDELNQASAKLQGQAKALEDSDELDMQDYQIGLLRDEASDLSNLAEVVFHSRNTPEAAGTLAVIVAGVNVGTITRTERTVRG